MNNRWKRWWRESFATDEALAQTENGRLLVRCNYQMIDTPAVAKLATADWQDDRFVPIVEYEFGIAWTNCCNTWRLSTGYTAAFWFNAVTTREFVNAVRTNNYVDVGDTISFDGLTARAEYMW